MTKKPIWNALLFTGFSFLYAYFLTYSLYLLFLSIIANLAITLRIMNLTNKNKLIFYLDIIIIFFSGLLNLFVFIHYALPEQIFKNNKYRKKLLFLLTIFCCAASCLLFSAHAILAIFNLFLISFNIFCIKILKKSPQFSFSKP